MTDELPGRIRQHVGWPDDAAQQVETLRAAHNRGELVEYHGRLVTREDIANAEHLDGGGIRFRTLTSIGAQA